MANSETVRRVIQVLVSTAVFDAPGLLSLRMWAYRRLFEIGRGTVLSALGHVHPPA